MKKQKLLPFGIRMMLFSILFLFFIPTIAYGETQKIKLSSTSSFLAKGETTKLKVVGTTKTVKWTSTDKDVATVSSSGKVSAVDYGTTYIKATLDKKTYKCKVVVVDPDDINFKQLHDVIVVNGKPVSLNPSSYDYSATEMKKIPITYKVSGNSGVKVSTTGNVTATKAGSFKITAYLGSKKLETFSMDAQEYTGFTSSEVSLDSYDETNVQVLFKGGFAPIYDDVTATSSDPSVAEVELDLDVELYNDINGYHCTGVYVRGLIDGNCTITVTASGITKKFKVLVGSGIKRLNPIEAIQQNNLTGYFGDELLALTTIRSFMDEYNLFSDTVPTRNKIGYIVDYFIRTWKDERYIPYKHGSIYRTMVDGHGVCGDYSETVCFLLDCLGINNIEQCGVANGGAHAWTKVEVDGKWYYLDAFWCANLRSKKTYFLTETLWYNHTFYYENSYLEDAKEMKLPPYYYDFH
ncbi:MAG: Ig-like domain-containing protein [Mobilitalea sp.]